MENRQIEYHLSASQIKTYQLCPLAYYFKYVENVVSEFIGSSFPFGRAMHCAFKAYVKGVTHISDLMQNWTDEWKDAQNGALIRYAKTDSPTQMPALAERMLLKLTQAWRPNTVFEVESKYRGKIAGYDVIGVVDAITLARDERYKQIVDLKTTATKGISNDYELQLGTYSILTGIERAEIVQVTKSLDPFVEIAQINAGLLRKRTERTFGAVGKAIAEGLFYPVRSYNCQNCGYSRSCEKW
jgi:CRISPR/Cas system-associated exonuclease Cas4 (RecB family)